MTSSPPRPALLQPEDLLHETYQVIDIKQECATGVIYRARNAHTDALVALHVLHPKHGLDPNNITRLRHAAHTVAHQAVAQNYGLHHTGDYGGLYFMVVELVEGPTLAEAIRARGPAPEDVLKTLALKTLNGLDELHSQGLICGGISPETIILRGGRASQPVMLAASDVLDSVILNAPEEDDPRNDLYDLGATLCAAATGRAPQTEWALNGPGAAERKSVYIADAPKSLRSFLSALTTRNSRRAPQSAAAAAAMMRTIRRAPNKRTILQWRPYAGWGVTATASLLAGVMLIWQVFEAPLNASVDASGSQRPDVSTGGAGLATPPTPVGYRPDDSSISPPPDLILAADPNELDVTSRIIAEPGAAHLVPIKLTEQGGRIRGSASTESSERPEVSPPETAGDASPPSPGDHDDDAQSPTAPRTEPKSPGAGWGAPATIFINENSVKLKLEIHKNCGPLTATPPQEPRRGYNSNRPLRLHGSIARQNDLDDLIDALDALPGRPEIDASDVVVLNPSVCVMRALTPPSNADSDIAIIFRSGHPDPDRVGRVIASDEIVRDEVLVIEADIPADMTGYLTAMLTSDNGSSLLLLPHLGRRQNDVQEMGVVEDGRRRIALSYPSTEANDRDKVALELDGVSFGAGLATIVVSSAPLIPPKELHANNNHYEIWLKDGYDELDYTRAEIHTAQRLTLDAGE